jgi:GNAT superfamily N-acetyltransferase
MIRPALASDLDDIVAMGALMHAESRYSRFKYSAEKVRAIAENLLNNDDGLLLVAERDNQIIGFFAGGAEEHFCSDGKISGDIAVYIVPEYRNGLSGPRLIDAYTGWAQRRGVEIIETGVSTGINLEGTTRLYRGLGYRVAGYLFEFGE